MSNIRRLTIVVGTKMYDLKGKNAVVTGAATGIGFNYVRDMLKAGVTKCAILDFNAMNGEDAIKKLTTEFGKDRVFFVKCDVTKMVEFESAMKIVMNTMKTMDILINNAGIMNDGDWEREIAVNVNGVINGTILGMRYMGRNSGGQGGTIVNIASILGLDVIAGCPVYVGTKHAVIGLTRSWGMPFHFKKTGVRMLVMCPGVTDTDLISGAGGRQMNDDDSKECHRELQSLPKQQPTNVSKAMMSILVNGRNNSVWVSEGGQDVYEVDIPERMEMRRAM